MKILLITNYWYPWNHSGTMRWLQLNQYIDFDVLTTKKPRQGFNDETLPKPHNRRLYRYFRSIPAVLSGMFLSVIACFYKYDIYIFTVPPYTLSLGAWILQAMGKKVILDIRDDYRLNSRWRMLNPVFGFFIKRIKHRTTCMQFMDEGATRVLSGYNPGLKLKVNSWYFVRPKRQSYMWYNLYIECGAIPDYTKHPNRQKHRYNCSSFVNYLYLGFKDLPTWCLHDEVVNQPVQSWHESANQMKQVLLDA